MADFTCVLADPDMSNNWYRTIHDSCPVHGDLEQETAFWSGLSHLMR